jgi:hypothetical protein
MEPSSSPARGLSSQWISASVAACRYSAYEAYATRQMASAECSACRPDGLDILAAVRLDNAVRRRDGLSERIPAGTSVISRRGRLGLQETTPPVSPQKPTRSSRSLAPGLGLFGAESV